MTHRCYVCSGFYPASQFYGDSSRPGGVSSRCIRCEKKRKPYSRQTNEERRVLDSKRAARYRREINEYKMSYGCLDCGYCEHPVALHLDHRDPSEKEFTVSEKLHDLSAERIWAEIQKCDVRCANCHMIRTYERRHHRTGKSDDPVFEAQMPLFGEVQ